MILANDGALSAYGKGSRFGIIHEELGFPLSDEHIDTAVHGQKISFEYVVEKIRIIFLLWIEVLLFKADISQ